MNMSAHAIPTTGVLVRGQLVVIGWPEPHEFDAITALRNAGSVRRWFVDDKPLDPQRNREWLLTGMKRPTEALLSIRLAATGVLLGVCGWSDWIPAEGVVTLGRFAMSIEKLRAMRLELPIGYKSIAYECEIIMRDFAFRELRVEKIVTSYMVGNRHAARVNHEMGLSVIGQSDYTRPDGSRLKLVNLELSRTQWERLCGVGS